jgi:hypothetical protein
MEFESTTSSENISTTESTPLPETTTFIDNLFALRDHSVILDSATASAGDETTMHNFIAFADVNFDGMSLDIEQDNIFSIGLASAAEENMETAKPTPEPTPEPSSTPSTSVGPSSTPSVSLEPTNTNNPTASESPSEAPSKFPSEEPMPNPTEAPRHLFHHHIGLFVGIP